MQSQRPSCGKFKVHVQHTASGKLNSSCQYKLLYSLTGPSYRAREVMEQFVPHFPPIRSTPFAGESGWGGR